MLCLVVCLLFYTALFCTLCCIFLIPLHLILYSALYIPYFAPLHSVLFNIKSLLHTTLFYTLCCAFSIPHCLIVYIALYVSYSCTILYIPYSTPPCSVLWTIQYLFHTTSFFTLHCAFPFPHFLILYSAKFFFFIFPMQRCRHQYMYSESSTLLLS